MLTRPSIRRIWHGYCCSDDTNIKPHAKPLNPVYTTYGPDWTSKLRYIKPYRNENQKDERLWPDKTTHLRTFKEYYAQKKFPEWTFYDNNFHHGKRCLFDGHHSRSEYCHNVVMCLGQEKRVLPNVLNDDRKIFRATNRTSLSTVRQKKRNTFLGGTALILPKIKMTTAQTKADVRALDIWIPSQTLAAETASIMFPTKKS